MGKVKLSDIAKEANVSIALVSYVLNNRLPERIKKETAERIKEIAKKLNYTPNQLAKGLRTQKSNAIGLILADLANPFSAQIARIIEDNVIGSDYILLIGSMDESSTKFQKLVDTFINHHVDGLIIVSPENVKNEIKKIQSQGIPYVLVDRYFPELSFNFVGNDNYFSTYECVKRLVANGRKSIGFITHDTNYFHFLERKRGFVEACEAFDLDNTKIVEVGFSDFNTNVAHAMSTLLAQNPDVDAVLFATGVLALHGLKYAIRNELDVPAKIEIMGFDKADYYDIFPAPIAYYEQPLEEIGKKAVDFLMQEIANPGAQFIQEIVRGSVKVAEPLAIRK